MTELEKRKKLLVVESEAYRELLKMELRNFRLYGRQTRRRISSLRIYVPAVMLLARLGRSFLFRKKRSFLGRMGIMLALGLKTFLLAAPLLRGFFSRQTDQAEPEQEEQHISSRI